LQLPYLLISNKPCLKPGFCLHSVRQAARSLLIWHSTHKTAKSVRPVCVGQEGAQHRPAKELSACSDLWCDGELLQPAVVLAAKMRVIKTCLHRQREILREEDFRPRAKRHPLAPVMLWITIFEPLVNKDGHDREPVVRLKQHLFYGD